MIPEADKPDCPDCARSGGSYDMACRGCVGRWLRFLRSLKAGETAFQSWCRAAAKKHDRGVVESFLREHQVRGYQ